LAPHCPIAQLTDIFSNPIRVENLREFAASEDFGVTALQDIVVVETAERVVGEYCGKLLADFGARVIKVERPAVGSPTRSIAPMVGPEGGIESSALFAYLNTNKESVVHDLASDDGRAALVLVSSSSRWMTDSRSANSVMIC
jgi:crotonobetainyl-CoA:carnitine CoA-transferase CaiB-like acyl-CoA transferase